MKLISLKYYLKTTGYSVVASFPLLSLCWVPVARYMRLEFTEEIIARDHFFGSHKNIEYLKSWFWRRSPRKRLQPENKISKYLSLEASIIQNLGRWEFTKQTEKNYLVSAEVDVPGIKRNTDGARKDY